MRCKHCKRGIRVGERMNGESIGSGYIHEHGFYRCVQQLGSTIAEPEEAA